VALIIEDGTGQADSETYADIAAYDDYATRFGLTQWAGLATEDKEVAARTGVRDLEASYSSLIIGSTTYRDQALAWPRTDAIDSEGHEWAYNEIPPEWIEATIAYGISRGHEELAALVDERISSLSAGSVSISYDTSIQVSATGLGPSVDRWLSRFLTGASGSTSVIMEIVR